jgi:hypothetical protein
MKEENEFHVGELRCVSYPYYNDSFSRKNVDFLLWKHIGEKNKHSNKQLASMEKGRMRKCRRKYGKISKGKEQMITRGRYNTMVKTLRF